jgi:hypothetical protein
MIKSKRWYENQIKALENAAKNTGNLMEKTDSTDNNYLCEVMKRNAPIQAECKIIYEKLNFLRAEYNLYYR